MKYLIFDMDGVLVDNMAFHKRAWVSFSEKLGCPLTEETLANVYGKTNRDTLAYLLKTELSDAEVERLSAEKEQHYRELFQPFLNPVAGLEAFLKVASQQFERLAIATSAPPANVDFVLDGLNIREYFHQIVDETMVSKGKPDPEIYLTSARCLETSPDKCIVVEDSISGVKAAKGAEMAVVGMATTHTKDELNPLVNWVVSDFNELLELLPVIQGKAPVTP
ncbi:MAG: HAD-IA family hydrolase [Vampirovibrio sp.]|nr:HAD-IA family hydrolase [Vampirovibrio sp.]